MITTIIISIFVFILLMLSIILMPSIKIKNKHIELYWAITLIGALILIILKCVPIEYVYNNLMANTEVNPIKILILFLSMTFLSVVLDELGLFKWASMKALKVASNNQLSIFLSFYFLAAILTIFTSNDIVILTLTPFLCFLCKNAKINPIPYLIGEFMAANTFSMMLIIGNPTNIYLATSQNITFIEYLKVMILPTLFSGAVEIGLILLVFHKSLNKQIEKEYEEVIIKDKFEAIVSICHLLICLVFLIISSYLNIEMWLVSLICAVSLLIFLIVVKLVKRGKEDVFVSSIIRLPWKLIPFVLSMFVIIIALDYQNVTTQLAKLLDNNAPTFTYGISSYLASNVINNIPMSILYSHLINLVPEGSITKATYASIVGSNIGAFLTPIGALAGIMFTTLTAKYETKLEFKTFIKYGALISIPVLLTALLVLSLIL